MSGNEGNPHIVRLRESLRQLKYLLSRSRAKQVQAKSIIEGSRNLVLDYFNSARPDLVSADLNEESLAGLDKWAQELLLLTQKAALKATYERTIRLIGQELNGVEISLVTAGDNEGRSERNKLDGKENRIAKTLAGLVPTASLSYEQACFDLRASHRKSYRGVAAELRESLRETLDYLAPDKDVQAQQHFKLEKGLTKPTMKQRMRFILVSRGKSKTVTAAPEHAVNVIEDSVGALARSVYDRSSLATHVGTTKQEVQQIKAYVDVVFGELLEIA